MARLAPASVTLAVEEREQLQQLIKGHNTAQQLALRARIIVLADAGHSHRAIARQLQISHQTARLWRQRWIEGQAQGIPVVERLQDNERSGAPATFTPEQLVQRFKLACDAPSEHGRPISQWTNQELADELVKQHIVESISARHVGRLLAEADLKPHQSGYWLNPPPTPTLMPKSTTSAPPT